MMLMLIGRTPEEVKAEVLNWLDYHAQRNRTIAEMASKKTNQATYTVVATTIESMRAELAETVFPPRE